MERLTSDICIIGAGPAGATAALSLSQKGIPFILADKDRFPRNKICGDGFSGKGLLVLKEIDERLITALHRSGKANPSWGARFTSPNLKSVLISFQENYGEIPPGYVIRRNDLDYFLLQEVKKTNSGKVLEGIFIREISRTTDGYILKDPENGMLIESRLLMIATGYDEPLIRMVAGDHPPTSSEGLGIRAYYENIGGFEDDNAIEIHFLKELLPCYLWIFPLGQGTANVGLALPMKMVREQRITLKDLMLGVLEKYPYLRKRFRNAVMTGKTEAHRLPFFHGKIPLSGDHYLLLGDAARLVDPFTGEGIGNAMISGSVAANAALAALQANDLSAAALAEYDRKLYARLEKELTLGIRLQELAQNAILLNLVIGKASRSKKVRELLREILFGMNSMKDLGKPKFYLKLMLGME